MRKLLVVPVLLLAGCGGTAHTHAARAPAASSPAACTTVPAHMGCSVSRAFPRSVGAGRVGSGFGSQGLDIANYQGFPDLARAKAAGLRFLIGQSNDGDNFTDFNFATNWIRARQLGIAHGAYLFARPGCASCQAALLASQVRRVGGLDSKALPPTIDAEVPGAYCNVSSIAFWLRRDLHISRVLTYTSPGLWSCGSSNGDTLLWAAIWGSPGYSFAGWSGFYVQQFCGLHCSFPGVSGEVDRDVDHGLLSLIVPVHHETPAQKRARERRELAGHEHVLGDLRIRIRVLRRVQGTYGCSRRRHAHLRLGKTCTRWFAEGDTAHRHGRFEDRKIAELKRALR